MTISSAKQRKLDFLAKTQRLHIIAGKSATIAGVEYSIGKSGNLVRVSSKDKRKVRKTKRGRRG